MIAYYFQNLILNFEQNLFYFKYSIFPRPYNGHWSKTMIGYGAEDSSFVCELTYNYEVGKYAMGNDFQVCLQ